MASKRSLTLDSYLRDLPYSLRQGLAFWLDTGDEWKRFAAHIPLNHQTLFSTHRQPDDYRYTLMNVMVFQRSPSPTLALLNDWEIDNVQVKHLIKALEDVKLLAPALDIRVACGSSPPDTEPVPNCQPAQREPREDVLSINSGREEDNKCLGGLSTSISLQLEKLQLLGNESRRQEEMCLCDDVQQVSFEMLTWITGNFDERDITEGGRQIGKGGFGEVFLGEYWTQNGLTEKHRVAVKRLKTTDEESVKQFETEVKTLCTYKHENIVILLGHCSNGPALCLVYEYIENGSLEDRLACLNQSSPLSVPLRLDIAKGTANGIAYLHGKGVTHRDIKTANILLDGEFKPKVSDFATARTLPQCKDMKTQVIQATTIIGSTNYLAPEAYDFKIHHGMDIFSFGVVLLELLTGLPVFDSRRENEDLKIHVEEYCTPCEDDDDDDEDDDDEEDKKDSGTIYDLVDKKPGVIWNSSLVEEFYQLSQKCLDRRMKHRPKIKSVLSTLSNMKADIEGLTVHL